MVVQPYFLTGITSGEIYTLISDQAFQFLEWLSLSLPRFPLQLEGGKGEIYVEDWLPLPVFRWFGKRRHRFVSRRDLPGLFTFCGTACYHATATWSWSFSELQSGALRLVIPAVDVEGWGAVSSAVSSPVVEL